MENHDALRLKSFFAPTAEMAMAEARKELGPDALLVDSRPAPPEAAHLGSCEVVLAIGGPPAVAPEPPPSEPHAGADVMAGLSRLSSQLSELSGIVLRKASQGSLPVHSVHEFEALEVLSDSGLSRDTAEEIVRAVAARASQRMAGEGQRSIRRFGPPAALAPAAPAPAKDPGVIFRTELEAELVSRTQAVPALGVERAARIAALVGPPGAGKTSTLLKLAFHYGLKRHVPVQLLSLDTIRIAGTEQLRACAGIMGIGFRALATPLALDQALAEHAGKRLILIDTPGFSGSDVEDAAEFASVLSRRQDIDIHLVLAASMSGAAMRRCAERFQVFRPAKLIFTRWDEAEGCGACFETAAETGKPVSFFATGPRLPDDLAEADTKWFVRSMLRNWPEQAVSAA